MEVPPNTQALIQLPSGKVVKEGSILIFQKNTVAKTIPKGIKGFKKNNHGFEAISSKLRYEFIEFEKFNRFSFCWEDLPKLLQKMPDA